MMPSMASVALKGGLDARQQDRLRHRQSVLRWARQHSYRPESALPSYAKKMMATAGLRPHDLEVPMTLNLTNGTKLNVTWLGEGEQPPPSAFGRTSPYQALVDELRRRPGRWACLGSVPISARKSLSRFKGVELVQRADGHGSKHVAVLYARIVDPDADGADHLHPAPAV